MAVSTDASTSEILNDLRTLVECESPTKDSDAVHRSARAVAALGERLVGFAPEWLFSEGVPYLRWTFGGGADAVLLLGHHDTVWPLGSWGSEVWTVDAQTASGPGIFDMKAGLVQILHAVAGLDDRRGITILVTSDEEIGSPSSRAVISAQALAAGVVLVTEASAPGGALKTARSGVAHYLVQVAGRAAHAGLEPERGVNATVEIARQVLAIAALGELTADATITPTLLAAGDSANTVPASARLTVDVRARTRDAFWAVDAALTSLVAQTTGATVTVERSFASPPLESASSGTLFELATTVAREQGLPPLASAAVGGASDGNIAADAGALVLDGLGAVGGGAHARGEHVLIDELEPRTVLLRELVRAIQGGRLGEARR